MFRPLILISLSILVCSGCAMTMENVNIDYSTPQPHNQESVLNAKLTIGEIEDDRSIEDPAVIIHKTNLNGQTTSGGYKADQPLCDIIKTALHEFYANFKVQDDTEKQYELYGHLIDFEYEAISGWSTVTLKPELTMKLYLKDLSNDKIVWNETFIARGVVEKFQGSKDAVNKMFQKALDDLFEQLSDAEMLNQFI